MRKLLVIVLMILLTSCSRYHKKDGPPNFYVDETKIGNAVPKAEPLSKYGNMKSYRVFGKRYYTLRSSKNYDQIGVASWYGTQFHSHSTSSGEPYDMLAMTAAHKTLPLPTYVQVTNLKNKRSIIVKVNDRGPFESNRIIDLSYVAAKKLGMLGHGTTRVRVRAIDPRNPNWQAPRWQSYQNARPVYFQVGNFKNKTNAFKLKQRLSSLLKAPVSVRRSFQSRLYQVHVGPIRDHAAADKIHLRLKDLGIKPNRQHGAP
jgi:rare lipoprotein A